MAPQHATPSTFADDPELAQLMLYFVRQLPQRIAALKLAARQQRGDELKLLTHQLRSGEAGGFTAIRQAAYELEVLVDNCQPSEAIDQCTADLAELCRAVVEDRDSLIQSPHVEHDNSRTSTA